MGISNIFKYNYPAKTKVHCDDPLAAAKISWDLCKRISDTLAFPQQDKVLLCIGTDRSTGDCLGPLVGTKVQAANQNYLHVCGTLEQPIHASNLREKIDEINNRFLNPYIIAVDACLGNLENVGNINVGLGAIHPGAGVNKDLPAVGDIHITGIVNVGGFLEFMVLQNTRLNTVFKLAEVISSAVLKVTSLKPI
jgi:putative sporulation protein YyaC